MKSNVIRIKKGELDLSAILSETEKTTKYNGLSGKEALSLRLLSEELVSMLPSIVKDFDGAFWISTDGAKYELNVEVSVDGMDVDTREALIKVSSKNKNAAVVGITGKIRAVFDYMALGGEERAMLPSEGRYGFATNIEFSYLWSLRQYQDGIEEHETEKWDEFEKSIIGKLADDVVVGVKGNKVNILIKKCFEEKKQ